MTTVASSELEFAPTTHEYFEYLQLTIEPFTSSLLENLTDDAQLYVTVSLYFTKLYVT